MDCPDLLTVLKHRLRYPIVRAAPCFTFKVFGCFGFSRAHCEHKLRAMFLPLIDGCAADTGVLSGRRQVPERRIRLQEPLTRAFCCLCAPNCRPRVRVWRSTRAVVDVWLAMFDMSPATPVKGVAREGMLGRQLQHGRCA